MKGNNLFDNQKDLLRKCIVFYATISQEAPDPSFSTSAIDSLTFQKIRRDLFPVLKYEERNKRFDLESMKTPAKDYLNSLMHLTDSEKDYISRFMAKEYRPELLFDDPGILHRIVKHPMALWKCR